MAFFWFLRFISFLSLHIIWREQQNNRFGKTKKQKILRFQVVRLYFPFIQIWFQQLSHLSFKNLGFYFDHKNYSFVPLLCLSLRSLLCDKEGGFLCGFSFRFLWPYFLCWVLYHIDLRLKGKLIIAGAASGVSIWAARHWVPQGF